MGVTRQELVDAVAFALREQHCVTGQKARVVVCRSPESLAATAVQAILDIQTNS